jgi:hypothetical protein
MLPRTDLLGLGNRGGNERRHRETLRVLDISHANSTGANPFVPRSFEITRCG